MKEVGVGDGDVFAGGRAVWLDVPGKLRSLVMSPTEPLQNLP